MKTIVHKAYEYATNSLQRIADKFKAPWNELRDALAEIYIAGANEALSGQWIDIEEKLPEIGQRVVWHCKVKAQRGTWIDAFIADTYDGDYMPENTWDWMPIPKLNTEEK